MVQDVVAVGAAAGAIGSGVVLGDLGIKRFLILDREHAGDWRTKSRDGHAVRCTASESDRQERSSQFLREKFPLSVHTCSSMLSTVVLSNPPLIGCAPTECPVQETDA